jgi:hypothetical protein
MYIKKHKTLAHQHQDQAIQNNTYTGSAMCNNSNTQEKESRNYNSMYVNK